MRTSEHEDLFDFGEEGKSALEAIDVSLHEEGWASRYTTLRGLRTWSEMAGGKWADSDSIDDYTNDLCARDALELALSRSRGDLRDRLTALVARADEQFIGATEADTDRLLESSFRIDSDAGWWWRRIPARGSVLNRYLASREPRRVPGEPGQELGSSHAPTPLSLDF